LSLIKHLKELARVIRENKLQVVIIDPLYLCLIAGSAGRRIDPANLFDMGPLLLSVTETCLAEGATPVLVHHFKKGRESPYDTPELEDLAFAGIQEFARQWVLIGRREKFEPGSGVHKLWLTVGGSAGHSGDWALDVNEGVMGIDFEGRRWEVQVNTASVVRQEAKEQSKTAKADAATERSKRKDEEKLRKFHEYAETAFAKLQTMVRATKTEWRRALAWDGDRMGAVVYLLAEQARIHECKIAVPNKKGTREVDGWEAVTSNAGGSLKVVGS
jgi:hypothetical protein